MWNRGQSVWNKFKILKGALRMVWLHPLITFCIPSKIIFCQNLWRANEIMEDLEYEQPRNSRWVSVADYYLSFSSRGLVYQKELFNITSLLVDGKNIVSRIAIRKTCCHLNIRGPTPLQELFVFWLLCRCLSQSPRQYNASPTILLMQSRG